MANLLFHSGAVKRNQAEILVEVTRQSAGWRLIDFRVHSLPAGQVWRDQTALTEACLILLEGECRIQWEGGARETLGPRNNVLEAYPSGAYLPSQTEFMVSAKGPCQLAEGRVPSDKKLKPQLIRPADCGLEIRGGGNATRQIIDIIPPDFPADRLLVCEVLTPSGNWSSYPPHKHDVDNPPVEVDLEEIYYYRFADAAAYGFQRVYTADGTLDETLKVVHGDVVLMREGYHPFVAAYGYHAYYLNILAGERRSMAASDDPRYVHLRDWPPPDPRVPLIQRPE